MTDRKIFKVFVASPSDVSELRKTTEKIINEVNSLDPRFAFEPYFWELNKTPGFLMNPDDYQNQIFNEFGSWCDIFIILFWSKFGKGTEKEYEHFKTTFVKVNPDIKFWCCRYAKPIDPNKTSSSTVKLNKWLVKEQENWAPLGGTRDAIKNLKKFEHEMRSQLIKLLLTYK
jgi:hypothetical protein